MAQDHGGPASDGRPAGNTVTRRDLLRLGSAIILASAAPEISEAASRQSASGMASNAKGPGGGPATCSGGSAIEVLPTSPQILNPFTDPPPTPYRSPVDRSGTAPGRFRRGTRRAAGLCSSSHQIWTRPRSAGSALSRIKLRRRAPVHDVEGPAGGQFGSGFRLDGALSRARTARSTASMARSRDR